MTDTKRDKSAAGNKGAARGQGTVYGRNPPARDEDQNVRGSGMTDIADEAQNQMPGTPQNITIEPRDKLEEPRRHEFDEAVAEHDKKRR